MNQIKTFANTFPKLDAEAVLLELEEARVVRQKLLEQRLINAGKSTIVIKRVLNLHAKTRKNNFSLHPLHTTWKAMWSRCANPKNNAFQRYGGRGIGICDQWKDFIQFVIDAGVRPKGKTIDRVDNDKGYSPENCRWATGKEQNENSNNPVFIEFNGKRQYLQQWSEELGIPRSDLTYRIQAGWPTEKLLSPIKRPLKPHCANGHLYTPETTSISKDGARICKTCRMLSARDWRRQHPDYYHYRNRL
jgi:hypothetical protein